MSILLGVIAIFVAVLGLVGAVLIAQQRQRKKDALEQQFEEDEPTQSTE